MATKNSVSVSLQVPVYWWRRLQRVSEHCLTTPQDFMREMLEAEVVRRELLHDLADPVPAEWLNLDIDPLPPMRLH
jgi:hypothetical protein